MEGKDNGSNQPSFVPEYGRFVFHGAYVYSLDNTKGFSLRGKITHLDNEDYLKAGYHRYNMDKNVERILFIGDNLYTLSKGIVKVHDLNDLRELKSLTIAP